MYSITFVLYLLATLFRVSKTSLHVYDCILAKMQFNAKFVEWDSCYPALFLQVLDTGHQLLIQFPAEF